MAVDTSKIGTPIASAKVVLERSALSNFARAVTDQNPIYHDGDAAQAAGFDGVPAAPTFTFAMEHWGKHPELQPDDDGPSVNEVLGPIMGSLMAKGGIILHGEQAFEYHRPMQAGDVLVKEGKVADIYEKETSTALMTFIVTEETWRDQKTGEPVVTSRMNVIHRGNKPS